HLGYFAEASIWQCEDMVDSCNGLWRGSVLTPGFFADPVPRRHRVMVAVAGGVAEECWCGASMDEIRDTAIHDLLAISDGDRASAHFRGKKEGDGLPEHGVRAAMKVAKLLERDRGMLWPELLKVARTLIKEGSCF